jgi:tetratricopeptide (TPR) repeat protein
MAYLGRISVNTAGVNKAEATSALAVGAAREWLRQAPAQPEAERALADALLSHGVTLRSVGRPSEARRSYEDAVSVGARLVAKYPADEELAFNYAVANEFLGEMCLYLIDGECGRRYGAVAVSALAPLIERHPQHARWREERARALSTVAAGLDRLAHDNPALHTRAVEASQDAYRVAQENARLNPDSRYEADAVSTAAERFGRALWAAGRKEQALAPFELSAAVIDKMYLKEPKNGRVRRIRAFNRGLRAELLIELKRWDAAVFLLREAADYVDEMIRDDPADQAALRSRISILKDQAVILERQGRLTEARARCREGLETAATLLRQDPAMEKELVNLPALKKEARKLGVRYPLLDGKAGPSP